MSVITYHSVSGNNIFDRLRDEGVIHEGDIYSPRRGEYVHFENVFDYTKCDVKTCAELDAREAKMSAMYADEVNKNDLLTAEQKADKIANNAKCDYHLMPVMKTEEGGMAWTLNYQSDDLPSVAIGRRYPNEVFDYLQSTEGHLDVSCKFKGEHDVTADGQPYDAVLCKVSNKQIRSVDERTSRVTLYVDATDKKPARLYCANDDIRPTDYSANYVWNDGYSDIVVRDKNKDLTLYRTLSDGTNSKESWSVDALSKAINDEKHRYRVQMAEKKSSELQGLSKVENQLEN